MQQSTVTGDFEITTSVTGTFNSTNYRGGILVWKDSSDFLRLERRGGNTVQMGGKLGSATFQYNIVTLPSDISPTYLKLEKVGSTLTGYWSSDGTTWNTVHSYTLSVSDPIDVGLFALNLGATPFSASFDYFDIIPPGLFSLPEYPLLGTIAVPAAMIGAYVVYKKKPNKKA
jgi:regulation of enolase protein 1 (concanavalin A-like superfamily)